jgi:hypothetical protein
MIYHILHNYSCDWILPNRKQFINGRNWCVASLCYVFWIWPSWLSQIEVNVEQNVESKDDDYRGNDCKEVDMTDCDANDSPVWCSVDYSCTVLMTCSWSFTIYVFPTYFLYYLLILFWNLPRIVSSSRTSGHTNPWVSENNDMDYYI